MRRPERFRLRVAQPILANDPVLRLAKNLVRKLFEALERQSGRAALVQTPRLRPTPRARRLPSSLASPCNFQVQNGPAPQPIHRLACSPRLDTPDRQTKRTKTVCLYPSTMLGYLTRKSTANCQCRLQSDCEIALKEGSSASMGDKSTCPFWPGSATPGIGYSPPARGGVPTPVL